MPSPIVLMRAIQEGLLSVSPRDRIRAALLLLALPDAGQARTLLADHALGDADAGVRTVARGALTLLDERADPTASSSIAPPRKLATRFHELVRDPRPRVRLGALAQVLKYKSGVLVELVERAMENEDDPEVLAAMVAVLAQRGSSAHLGAIARLLDHPDPVVVERAVHAVAFLGREAVLPLLEPFRQHAESRVREAAVAACDELDPDRLVVKLVRPQAVEAVAERLASPDARERLAGLEAAAAHMSDPGIEGLVEVLSELDAEPRVADAARALIDGVAARAAAEAPTPPTPTGVAELESSWVRLPPRQLAAKRLRARLAHPDERVRTEALEHLRAHPVKALLPVVLDRLGAEDLPVVKASLVRTVGVLGSDAEVPRLASYLTHGNPHVVRAALLALHRLGGDEMLPLFLTLLARPDPRVQEQAVAALLRLGPDQLLSYVITMAKSSREDARSRALTLLERVNTPVVEDLVLDMLEREQSDRLIPREMFLLARTASPRSIGLIWTIRRRRPTLSEQFQLVLNKLSDRWNLSLDDIRARGDVFIDEHPELLEPPAPPETPKRPQGRWTIFSLREELDRRWVGLTACLLWVFACYHFDVLGFGSALSPGGLSVEAERALMEQSEGLAYKPAPAAPELPPLAYAEALEAVAACFVTGLAEPSRDEVMTAERVRLKAQGFTHEPYLDMEARGAYRGPSNRAVREATDRIARGDLEAALTVLNEALAMVESENLLVRADLTREIARLLVKLGRLDEARVAALLQVALRRKIVAVRRATTKPGGGSLGTHADEQDVERAGTELTAAFDEARRRVLLTGSPTGLTPEEEREAHAQLEKLAREGKITPEEHREALANTPSRTGRR